ncbi:hypothetical protein [Thermoanaerobacterium sp. RBIITD]|nr:hypothetical protein [Thermoanaerobacterium sp. RBIITD]
MLKQEVITEKKVEVKESLKVYICPDCGAKLVHESGCIYCPFCGYS